MSPVSTDLRYGGRDAATAPAGAAAGPSVEWRLDVNPSRRLDHLPMVTRDVLAVLAGVGLRRAGPSRDPAGCPPLTRARPVARPLG